VRLHAEHHVRTQPAAVGAAAGRFARIVTTVTEHNAVFLSTIAAARRAGIPRVVVERDDDARVLVDAETMRDAVVVVSAMDNVIGAVTPDLRELITSVHRVGGIVIVDAAQAAGHAWSLCAVSTPTRSASRRTRCTDRRSASSSPPVSCCSRSIPSWSAAAK
jgi:hypothetical protein